MLVGEPILPAVPRGFTVVCAGVSSSGQCPDLDREVAWAVAAVTGDPA